MSSTILTLGETMGLFQAHRPGSAAHADEFRLGIGGAESNLAVGVARLGGRSRWIGRVGADGVGQRILRELRAEGVDVRAAVDDGAPTGIMVKTRRADRVVVDYHRAGSAASRLSPADVTDDELWRDVAMLHVTGITLALSPSAADAVHAAVDRARDRGVRVSVDINHRATLWRGELARARAAYRRLVAHADIVFAGEDEARILVDGETTAGVATALSALTAGGDVIVKRGAAGALALVDGRLSAVDPVPVEAVDTVGAGDAFAAGYLADLVAGRSAADALRTAARAGAFACLHPGDWEGLPHRADLDLLDTTDPVQR